MEEQLFKIIRSYNQSLLIGVSLTVLAFSVFTIFDRLTGDGSFAEIKKILEAYPLKEQALKIIIPGEHILSDFPSFDLSQEKILPVLDDPPFLDISSSAFEDKAVLILKEGSSLPVNVSLWKRKTIKKEKRWTIEEVSIPFASFPTVLNDMRVETEENGITVESSKKGEKLITGKNEWNYLGLRRVRIGGKQHDCLWIHPEPGQTITLLFPDNIKGFFRMWVAVADSAGNLSLQIKAGGTEHNLKKIEKNVFYPVEIGKNFHSVSIATERKGRNHLCLYGEFFHE
jgi:hypothetical protein